MDYLIMEAVTAKVAQEDVEVAKKQEREAFKHDRSNLDQYR